MLGLDGVPYSLMKKLCSMGRIPNLQKIIDKNEMKEIKSVYPVISSVAWTGFATGVNPAEHGIFGFVDRNTVPFQMRIPTSRDRKAEPIWTTLSRDNKKVIVINVPITYPVEPVNGKMVSCFLCPNINKGTYPKELATMLKENDYIIDADAWMARTDKAGFIKQLFLAMEARFNISMELMQEDWDYFQLHIMETDRLMHFFWYDIEDDESEYFSEIMQFFSRLDELIGCLAEKLVDQDSLIILSDHGFCGIKKEVQMNTWLKERKFLVMGDSPYDLRNYSEQSLCYSLLPGRFYINLKGREEKGSVPKERYNQVRNMIKEQLLSLRDPETNKAVIQEVFFREEIYSGEYLKYAPDIIAQPYNGYDLKGMLENDSIFTNSELTGMHTYEDAVIIGKNFSMNQIETIQDVRAPLLKLFNL